MKIYHYILLTLIILLTLAGCSSDSRTSITGTIDYLGESEFYIEIPPLHYKYSKKNRTPIQVSNGKFETKLDIKSSTMVWIVLQDIQYPLFINPSDELVIEVTRAKFPFDVKIKGTDKSWNDSYQTYIKETDRLETLIKAEMDKFRVGQKNQALAYSKMKLESAEKNLKNTNLHPLYLKIVGEDLVLRLRAIEYSNRFISTYDADVERKRLLNSAKEVGFFSIESLEAQRAGIRDITHYYSRTFGIYDSVITAYGEVLAEYDIKGVAYNELNKKRIEVLDYIDNPKATAYAELFLVAERIGEQPFKISKPSFEEYVSQYEGQYSEYIAFLTSFYDEIKSVSPGEPAIPFTLSDQKGNTYTLDDFKGKFLLLDFWAGWCQPCLAEFEDMRDIYSNYSREELEIIGISTEIDKTVWEQDIKKFENPWIQVYGGNGMEQETFKAYKGGGIPFYILVDPDGKISRYNDIRPSFNFKKVLDNLIIEYKSDNLNNK